MQIAVFLVGVLISAGSSAQDAPPAQASNSCLNCHRDLDEGEKTGPTLNFDEDVHSINGLACESCHGGDPSIEDTDAMSPDHGFVGSPKIRDIPGFCGRCHSDPDYMRGFNPRIPVDQVEKYWSSGHGKALRGGSVKPATCVSCHSAHNIRPASDRKSSTHPINLPATCGGCHSDPDYMAGTGLPTDQLELFRSSVHGVALLEQGDTGSPSCNDCHGTHGAMPPKISKLSRVCGLCHVRNMELFQGSVHASAFDDFGFPECEACHGNHGIKPATDAMLDVESGAVCLDCHTDTKGAALTTAATMHKSILDLADGMRDATSALNQAQDRGMYVDDALFDLSGAKDHLIKARTQVHAFTVASVQEETSAGMELVAQADSMAANAMKQFRYRRNGLALSTLILTALVVLLAVKIRRIEGN